jgi:hypothetical protein
VRSRPVVVATRGFGFQRFEDLTLFHVHRTPFGSEARVTKPPVTRS